MLNPDIIVKCIGKNSIYLAFCETGDESEIKGEEEHQAAHRKYVEIIRKFSEKLDAAYKRYKGRLAELEGAMNPEAEAVQTERYKQEKYRLQVKSKSLNDGMSEHTNIPWGRTDWEI